MLTRDPIDVNMLKEDFCIKNECDIITIMIGLEDGSKNYLEKLRKTYNNYKSNVNCISNYIWDCCIIV